MSSVLDMVSIVLAIFLSVIAVLIGLVIIGTLVSIDTFSGASYQAVLTNFKILDQVIFVAVVGLCIATILFAYFIPTHPIFYFSWVLTGLIGFVLSPALTNAFKMVAENEAIVSYSAMMPLSNAVMSNLPMITLFITVIMLVVAYGKPKNQGLGELV